MFLAHRRRTALLLALTAGAPRAAEAHFEGSGIVPVLHGASHALSLSGTLAVIAISLWFGSVDKQLARVGVVTLVLAWIVGMMLATITSAPALAFVAPLSAAVSGALLALKRRPSEILTLLTTAAVGLVLGWIEGNGDLDPAERVGAVAATSVVSIYAAVIAQAAAARGANDLLRATGALIFLITPALAIRALLQAS